MRVCFTGAGGTGKTTTMDALLKIMPNLQSVPSISRQVYASNNILAEQDFDLLAPSMKVKIQDEIRETQWKTFENRRGIISDRSPADHFAYYLNYCGDYVGEDQVRETFELTQDRLRTFDYIFYFPLQTYAGQDDGMRKVMFGYRYRYNLILRIILKDMDIPYFTLRSTGTPEERAERIASIIKKV
jgi:predicted ATPase